MLIPNTGEFTINQISFLIASIIQKIVWEALPITLAKKD